MRVVGSAALVLALVAFGVFVVRRLVRSWHDTYGGPGGAGGGNGDQG